MASSVRYEIHLDQVLGVGSYGKVCMAKYGQVPCAAKLLHEKVFESGDPGKFAKRFEQECQFVSTIRHPNIVQYLATVRDPQSQRLVLLMELMDELLTGFLERSACPIPYHTQINICRGVALALSFLHSNAIIHKHLSADNVLLTGEGSVAKLANSGMSRLMSTNPCMTPLTQYPAAAAYMPPEALTTQHNHSSKLDCFSYGVLTVQIITKKSPKPGDAYQSSEDRTRHSRVRMPEIQRRKKDIDLIEPNHPLLPIVLYCLKDRDTERPSADEICERLTVLKGEERYKQSMQQTRNLASVNLMLQEQLAQRNQDLEKERADHEREKVNLQNQLVQRSGVQRTDHLVKPDDVEMCHTVTASISTKVRLRVSERFSMAYFIITCSASYFMFYLCSKGAQNGFVIY